MPRHEYMAVARSGLWAAVGLATKIPKNCLKTFPEFLKNVLKISGFTSKNPIKTPKKF